MENKNVPNLDWLNNIKKLNQEKRKLKELPENERELYIEDFGELSYNWDKIYDLLFNKDIDDEMIDSKNAIPNGIKELYEIDENGNPTGYFNWDYALDICESISGTNVHEMWDTEYENEIYELIINMPEHMGYIISNIDNPEELYETLIKDLPEPDLDCPKEIRENKELICEMFELCNFEDIINCFDFMSDELKKDKDFLAELFNLEKVKKDGEALLFKISPEVYADDEFKMKMIECWGITVFERLWEETSHLWDTSMESIDDKLFYDSISLLDLKCLELEESSIYNPELAKKINDEINRRTRDKDVLSVMKTAVGKTIGRTLNAENSLDGDKINEIDNKGEEYGDY